MQTNSPFKRLIMAPLVVMGVLLMLVEEHLWDWLVAFGRWLGHLPLLRIAEARLRALPPRLAACALLLPVACIFPIKVLAVWLMATGHWGLGLTVLLTAKVVGTAVVARIYTLCEPALTQLRWFVHLRARIMDAKDWAHRRLEVWAVWQMARQALAALKAQLNKVKRVWLRLG